MEIKVIIIIAEHMGIMTCKQVNLAWEPMAVLLEGHFYTRFPWGVK